MRPVNLHDRVHRHVGAKSPRPSRVSRCVPANKLGLCPDWQRRRKPCRFATVRRSGCRRLWCPSLRPIRQQTVANVLFQMHLNRCKRPVNRRRPCCHQYCPIVWPACCPILCGAANRFATKPCRSRCRRPPKQGKNVGWKKRRRRWGSHGLHANQASPLRPVCAAIVRWCAIVGWHCLLAIPCDWPRF